MTSITAPVVRVSTPGGLRNDLMAIKVVWQRDIIRYCAGYTRIIGSLVQPVLFLLVLGTGLSQLAPTGGGVDLRTFFYPGVLAMSTLFTAFASSASIVWDREFGFMREMLVAPVRRAAIVVGKCLGGATVATAQGVVILVLAGAVGVPYDAGLMFTLLGQLLLLSFMLTAFGVMAAARMSDMQSFMAITQMVLMPLYFLSGALYPLGNLPTWLQVITHVNPLTYAVDPMRRAVFSHVDAPQQVSKIFEGGVTWFGWPVSTAVQLLLVAGLGSLMLAVAVWEFRKAE